METNWAAENLQTIRTLMERSAVYRRALAPVSTYVGIVGIGASLLALAMRLDSLTGFSILWMTTSLVALSGAFLLVRRQSIKDREPFWSAPTKRITQAMFPCLFIGMFFGVVTTYMFSDPGLARLLVSLWTALYGCALHSAAFFMPRGVRRFASFFVLAGCTLLVCSFSERWWSPALQPHLLMGVLFGASHLAYGIYLYFTEKRKNEA